MRKNLVFLALLCAIVVMFCGSVSAADVPSANFTSNVTNGTAPLSVQFNDTSAGNVTSWSWDFGDGSNSTDENPVHNYTKAGTYSVSLTAGNDAGNNTVTQTNYITVLLNDAYVSTAGSDTTGDGTSTSPYATLQKALNNVATGGTIHLASGTYTGTGNYGLTISKNVNFVGEDQTTTIIDAASAGSIFTVNSGVNVTVANLTFANGNSTYGGAIYNNGTLNASDCTFTGNTVGYGGIGYGGAISNGGTISSLSGCTFTGNTAEVYGSAIYNSGTISSVNSCTFTNNTGIRYGGVIYNYGGTITSVSGCNFANNTANVSGGVIDNSGTIGALSGCTFTNNTAFDGGVIENEYKATINSVSGCTFTGNKASDNGGAICNMYGTINSLSACTFTNNTAPWGGAIFNKGTIGALGRCTFNNNTATNGGAIYNYISTLTLSGCTFTGNNATQGSAIYNIGSSVSTATTTVHFSSFVNNTATDGSTIYSSLGTVNALNNWWGSNNSPSSQVNGNVDYSNWLYMTITVNPAADGSTGNVTVSFNNVYDGATLTNIDPANGHIPDGDVVNFSGSSVTFNPVTAVTHNGTATTEYTANDTSTVIHATADSQTVSTYINGIGTMVSVDNVTGFNGGTVSLTAILASTNGTRLSGQTVTFTVNGISYNATTDDNGVATLRYTITESLGTYNITASFAGSTLYGNCNGMNYLVVLLRDVYVSPMGSDTTGDGTESNSYATIQKALNDVIPDGTIHLLPGTYTGTGNKGLTITKNVNIVGTGQTSTIIDAQGLNKIFTVNSGVNVTVANLTFANGNSTYGGAIYNNGALNVSNCTFTGNTATYGGAIYNAGTITFLSGCTFTGNTATASSNGGNGGAIFTTGTISSLSGCTFTGNTATYGGAIYNSGGTISSLSGCTFTGNTATYGGAIYNAGTITSLSACNLTGNNATQGGAVYNNKGNNITWSGCTFTGNTATYGGAIYNMGKMNVGGCTFTGNNATQGGAIYNNGGTSLLTVHFSSFINNTALTGSAVYRSVGTVNTQNNWWSSNNNPSSQVYGNVDYSNWLYMTETVPGTVVNGSSANVTVSFNNVWNGTGVSSIDPANGTILDGTVVNFTSGLGSFSPVTVTTVNGIATTNFTANAAGIGTVNATSGNQSVFGSVTVYDVPVAGFSASPTNGTSPLTVQFTDRSSNSPTSWLWSFGDGSTSTEQNPVHTYSNAGNYTVILTVGNAAGNNTVTQANCVVVSQDITVPVVLNVTPTGGAGDLPVNQVITVTFSEPISAGAAYDKIKVITPDNKAKTITKMINGNQLIITAVYDYVAGDTYKLVIPVGSVTDLAGNNLTNAYNSNFTIGTVPTVTGVDPVDKAGNVSTTKTITVTFSNNVTVGAAYDKIKVITPNGQAKVISKTLNGNQLVITAAYSYTPGTYTVYIPVGAVQSFAGNSLKTAYNSTFTVSSGPTVSNVNTTGLSVNKTITVTFSSNIVAGANFSKIKVITLDNKAKVATVTINGNQLIITAAYNYTPGSYTLSIPANSLTDSNGNAIAENYTKTVTI